MVEIRYFSILREKLGKEKEEFEFEGTVSELRKLLLSKYPEIENILNSVKFAVNEEYVDEDYKISDGDRVALIPPVSGG
ncbi:molybdopterin converting factor subunit 1 [Aquifex aeolicus]|uniref:molybdopterin converting factor subunit 1 n=1 Tax=Aquifex aeolicus TaxID=63363 RepID=UPI0000168488|nr:molybdopterin converting factor subunit 1 [Aquifex aeolicus]